MKQNKGYSETSKTIRYTNPEPQVPRRDPVYDHPDAVRTENYNGTKFGTFATTGLS